MELAEVDWAFRNLSNEGVHSFHWYPATFLSAIPGTLIPLLSKKTDIVLDPFCGTATTGVEAIRLGRRFIGIDTNPVAILIAHAKLYPPEGLRFKQVVELNNLRFLYSQWNPKMFAHPQTDTLLRWYDESTYLELAFLLEHISRIENTYLRNCAQAVFSSILKHVSSQSRHWGWVCDNVVPKENELHYKDAIGVFENATSQYLHAADRLMEDLKHRDKNVKRTSIRDASNLVCDDCVSSMTEIDDRSIDLILSSPPYYGVADYIKAQRLSLLWFDHPQFPVCGYGFSDFEELRHMETGSRSFRHRKNSFEQYILYMTRFFEQSQRVLKKNSYLALVLGESNARTPTLESLILAAQNACLTCVYQSTRDIRPTRRRLLAKVRGEDIVVFRVDEPK